jgi:predicted RNase H-like nuclease (RuvC/YqgF family)
MRAQILTLTLALTVPAAARAQEPVRPQHPAQGEQMTRMQRMQENATRMERLMTQIRDMNQWMTQQHACDACLQMGKDMEQTGQQLQTMLQRMEQLNKDPHIQGDQTRLRDMDRLQDRLRDMIRQMDQARDALRKIAGGK